MEWEFDKELANSLPYWKQLNHVGTHFPSIRTLPSGYTPPTWKPQRPWSHVAIDFLTDLPELEGKTTIMVTMDRFSRAVKLIPLPSLPTSLETAELMFQCLLFYYGIPEDILIDRGPQFISKVWKGFMEKLGWVLPPDTTDNPMAKLRGWTKKSNPNITGILIVDEWFKRSEQVGRVLTKG